MRRPRKTLLINPDPTKYSRDSCPSFAQVNHGVEFQPEYYVLNVIIQPVDWNKELNRTSIDWDKLRPLAQSWVTCACGNTCIVILRDKDSGYPLDNILRNFGSQFYAYIQSHNRQYAMRTLLAIEKRSSLIINRIYA